MKDYILATLQRKCTGCMTCVMACSFVKEKVYSPSKSRIRILKKEQDGVNIPIVCRQCRPPPACQTACPVGAITVASRVIRVDSTLCIGCGECVLACPFGAMSIDPNSHIAFTCDFCGGKPECVSFCSQSALQYLPISSLSHLATEAKQGA